MKKLSKLLLECFFLISAINIHSQTFIIDSVNWQNDPISGVFDLEESVIIKNNGVLTISPGTVVRAIGNYGIFIEGTGRLFAAGTEQDSIIFDVDYDMDGTFGEEGEYWKGIRFGENNPMDSTLADSSKLVNVYIAHGRNQFGGGLFVKGFDKLSVCKSFIYNNLAISPNDSDLLAQGGGIYCENSNIRCVNTSIIHNTAKVVNNINDEHIANGGGIYLLDSKPTFLNLIISGNYVETQNYFCKSYGGGIYSHNSQPTISFCRISSNSVSAISNYTVLENGLKIYSYSYGGGCFFSNSITDISDSDILDNNLYSYSDDIEPSLIPDYGFSSNSRANGGGLLF